MPELNRLPPSAPDDVPDDALEVGQEDRLLLSLLDPARPLDDGQHSDLVEMLRTHPRFADELAGLENLTREAGTEEIQKAAEADRMFQVLCDNPKWSDPSELLGSRVPYAQLLAIAEARIAATRSSRESQPKGRLVKFRQRLEKAERQAAARPVAACMEALQELGISRACAEKVFSRGLRSDLD